MTATNNKRLYLLSTGLLGLFILPGIFFLNGKMAMEGTAHLGLPLWFHWELGIAKFIGGLILVLPFIPARLKEWTYVAFGIDFISAMIAFTATDGLSPMILAPLLTLLLLILSYRSWHRLRAQPAQVAVAA